MLEFTNNTRNVRSGDRFMELNYQVPDVQKSHKLFQKNLKRLGLILLECVLLSKSFLHFDLTTRSRNYLRKSVDTVKRVYDFENKFEMEEVSPQNRAFREKKRKVLTVIENLVMLSEKELGIEEVFHTFFLKDRESERYTV